MSLVAKRLEPGWIKMPLGKEVGLGPGHIVIDVDQAPPPKRAEQPQPLFGPCLLWSKGRPSQLLLTAQHFTKYPTSLHI